MEPLYQQKGSTEAHRAAQRMQALCSTHSPTAPTLLAATSLHKPWAGSAFCCSDPGPTHTPAVPVPRLHGPGPTHTPVVSAPHLHGPGPSHPPAVSAPHLDGLGDVHLVYLDLGKTTPRHIFVLLVIAIEEVSGINSNTDGALRSQEGHEH